MKIKIAVAVVLTVLAGVVCKSQQKAEAQEQNKPKITKITILPPPEVMRPSGNCKTSTGGYIKKTSKAEIGDFVDSSLREGYIVTLYPETKDGIFVIMECTNSTP